MVKVQTNGNGKIYVSPTGGVLLGNDTGGSSIIVDSAISSTSENPVQNKVIYAALNDKVDSSSLASVATSGAYSDLTGTPTIPAAQIQSDWNQTDDSALDYIKNKPNIPEGVIIDQTYDPESTNAQSGVAIAGAGFLTSHQDISGKQDTSNLVTSISSFSTDAQYPSAKCVYDIVGDIESTLDTIIAQGS